MLKAKCLKALTTTSHIKMSTDNHGALKRAIRPTRGFQTMKTAAATLTGFETMRIIRHGHCLQRERQATDKARLVNQLFGLAA